ncbi:MAG: nuclease [Calditrichaeota bacterium]|nr:MAG: nuclease [Calditrichota bacterium]
MHQGKLYHYRAVVTRVYDGDTIWVQIDLGFYVEIKREKIRLARIDAPEIRGPERSAGLAARDFLRDLILNQPVLLQTLKDRKGKYGRYLGEVWLEQDGRYINVNDLMVAKGYATPWP